MYEKEIAAMKEAALKAEKKILEVYATNFSVEIKSDDSPVTAADRGADAIIREELGKDFPGYAFLTEESKDTKERLKKEFVFIVDPVDGTKEFVSRNGEFCTNIALCRNHELVAGLINIPTKHTYYYAVKGEGAYRVDETGTHRIHVSERKDHLRVLRSISFATPEEKAIVERNQGKIESVTPRGAAVKFCLIAEGSAEVMIRTSLGTKEWDTAAGEIILEEAGGFMRKMDGSKYSYNREDVYNREPYELLNSLDNFLR